MMPGINDTILYNNLKALGYSVYPMAAPEDAQNPLVVYHKTSEIINNYLNGNNFDKIAESRFLVSVYTNTYRQLKVLTNEIVTNLKDINNLDGSQVVVYQTMDSREDNDFRCKIDLKIITTNVDM
jgi:hypothetical protein